MSDLTIRPAYSKWSDYQRAFRDVVAGLTDAQLAAQPSPDRWPLWATVGHAACQRVFWLCDFAGEPGAETTRFTNAAYDCPGNDDLEHVLHPADLVEALDSTFRIVEGCLDRWTLDMLDETLRRPEWDGSWVHTCGSVLQRCSRTTSRTSRSSTRAWHGPVWRRSSSGTDEETDMDDGITAGEFETAGGTEDWPVLADGAYAYFATASFAASAALVQAIAALPGATG